MKEKLIKVSKGLSIIGACLTVFIFILPDPQEDENKKK